MTSTDWMRPPPEDRGSLPPEVDTTRPSIARVYDYALGGKDNFAVDRAAAEAVWRAWPELKLAGQEVRLALRRMVRHLVGAAGIRQLLDLGSGLPTAGNVHEIAHEVDPRTRVVYVDNDPIVLAHARALLTEDETTTVILGDLMDPDTILDDPVTRSHLDLDQPYAVLLSSVLHHLSDEQDPAGITARLTARLPAGGYLLCTNFLDDGVDPRAAAMERTFLEGDLGTGRVRTFAEQLRFFDGLELVDPGLVRANDWHPDQDTPKDSPLHNLLVAGLARKP